ncbi:hypothetical protein B5M09_002739 [Aphanomyces astaci]|uniref:Uncharacterized protein n=1 Tax=Aphanomyces astaci TaxID=112090 RepID=A0A425DAR5_APHAT|nr:hypothetical protein B5M09_002739 [Aphanomyces astaci]
MNPAKKCLGSASALKSPSVRSRMPSLLAIVRDHLYTYVPKLLMVLHGVQIWALRVPVPRLGRRTDRGTETTVPAIGHGTVGLRLGIGRVTVETGRLGIGRVTDGSVRVTVMETAATTVHGTDPVTAVIEDAIIVPRITTLTLIQAIT